MKEKELIDDIMKYRDLFECEDSDIELLKKMTPDKLGLMNQDVYQVTPLLKQITGYALICHYFIAEELKELEEEMEYPELLDDLEDLVTKCVAYVAYLIDNNCHHPTILLFNDLTKTEILYESILNNINSIVEILSKKEAKTEILDEYSDVDNDVVGFYDEMREQIAEEINHITNLEQLANTFRYCSLYRAHKKGLINSENYYYIGDDWCRLASDKLPCQFSILIEKIGRMYSNSEKINLILFKIKDGYKLYKNYQYLYLKDKYKEDKILEKCK